jgi:two-component system, cell cycle response regulator CpdR
MWNDYPHLRSQSPAKYLTGRCRKKLHLEGQGCERLPNILIVDDEHAVRLLLSRSFARAGYDVTTAASALEAMTICGAKTVHMVLSDVDMPGINGHELARWVAIHHPETRYVLMSGFGTECEECPFVGRCTLLRKPFPPKEGVALITQLLSERPT